MQRYVAGVYANDNIGDRQHTSVFTLGKNKSNETGFIILHILMGHFLPRRTVSKRSVSLSIPQLQPYTYILKKKKKMLHFSHDLTCKCMLNHIKHNKQAYA